MENVFVLNKVYSIQSDHPCNRYNTLHTQIEAINFFSNVNVFFLFLGSKEAFKIDVHHVEEGKSRIA